jgi:hypothetical protein
MIEQNGSITEKDSPYFILNKIFCEEFEDFILERNGKVKGSYNAWSFSIAGKICDPNIWILNYKKSTYSSGNLMLSTKGQNVLTSAEWKTKNIFEPKFKIRRKKFTDLLSLKLTRTLSTLDYSNKYVVDIQKQNDRAFKKLLNTLKPLFISEEIYEIENVGKKFRVELRTDQHHFKIFNQLAELAKRFKAQT